MTPDLDKLKEMCERATGTGAFSIAGLDRPLPWEVWTSNSYRRVKSGDGRDVLSAYAQASDGHPDLSMPEDRLVALIEAVNAFPALIAKAERVEALERVLNLLRSSAWSQDNGGCWCPFHHDVKRFGHSNVCLAARNALSPKESE